MKIMIFFYSQAKMNSSNIANRAARYLALVRRVMYVYEPVMTMKNPPESP